MFLLSKKFLGLLAATAVLFSGDEGLPLTQALNCWECNATVIPKPVLDHQCNEDNFGVSVECPGPNGVCIVEVRTSKGYSVVTILRRTCWDVPQPHLGKCMVTTEDKVGKIEECHCNTDECNKGLIDDKGGGGKGGGNGGGKGGDKKNSGDALTGKLFGVVSMMMIFIVCN